MERYQWRDQAGSPAIWDLIDGCWKTWPAANGEYFIPDEWKPIILVALNAVAPPGDVKRSAFVCTDCKGYGDCVSGDGVRLCASCLAERLSNRCEELEATLNDLLRAWGPKPRPTKARAKSGDKHRCEKMPDDYSIGFRGPGRGRWWMTVSGDGVIVVACPFCGAWL